jgi:hypothetical protein
MANDALGNEVIIGRRYGYATSKNGINEVVTGTALSVKEKRVTLSGIQESRGVYGEVGEFVPKDRSRSVHACNVFPIFN